MRDSIVEPKDMLSERYRRFSGSHHGAVIRGPLEAVDKRLFEKAHFNSKPSDRNPVVDG
jgi:hypothetical protein